MDMSQSGVITYLRERSGEDTQKRSCLTLAMKRLWVRLFQQCAEHPQPGINLRMFQFFKARETYQAVTLISVKLRSTVFTVLRSISQDFCCFPSSRTQLEHIVFPQKTTIFLVKTIPSLDYFILPSSLELPVDFPYVSCCPTC